MTTNLDDLDPVYQPKFFELLARFTAAGVPVMIINVLRTNQEQIENIKKGVSWTMNSRHLPQPPSMKSHAIDVCPYELYQLHGPDKLQWNSADPAWLKLGLIGENLGFRWGGRWKDANGNPRPDSGHFECNQTTPSIIKTI